MIVLTTHQFGHRLLENGIMQSAEFDGEKYSKWEQKADKEMNLTGADVVFLRDTLKRMAQIFPKDYRLPSSESEQKSQFRAHEPR